MWKDMGVKIGALFAAGFAASAFARNGGIIPYPPKYQEGLIEPSQLPANKIEIHDEDLVTEEALWCLYERWISNVKDYSRSADEKARRFENFKKRAIFIHNGNKVLHSYRMGLNDWADADDEEREKRYTQIQF